MYHDDTSRRDVTGSRGVRELNGRCPLGPGARRSGAQQRWIAEGLRSGTPKASTSSRACGRSSAHRALTSAITALARDAVSRPCSWNQPRSASIVDEREQVGRRVRAAARLPGSVHASIAATNARSSTASMCARAASSRWSCASLNTANGSSALGGRGAAGVATVSSVCFARHSNRSSCHSRSSRLALLVRAGARVEQALQQPVPAHALEHRLEGLVGDEAGGADQVQLAEVVAEAGEQLLGDQLEQDGVVALEGGEDVGVGLESRAAGSR